MRRARIGFAIVFGLMPFVLCFAFNREFWPFTHFPMYSKASKRVVWTQLRAWPRGGDQTGPGEVILDKDCFHPFGTVRFHYALLNFMSPRAGAAPARDKVDAMVGALARQWGSSSCSPEAWGTIQAYLVWFEPDGFSRWKIENPSEMRAISSRFEIPAPNLVPSSEGAP